MRVSSTTAKRSDGELAVVEEVEEALHVGEVAAFAGLLRAGGETRDLALVALRCEERGARRRGRLRSVDLLRRVARRRGRPRDIVG